MTNIKVGKDQDCFKGAFKVTVPVFFAYFPLSMLFSVLLVHQGYDWYLAPLMSATLFAGAVQFLVLTMLQNNDMMISIFIAAFFVGFRNVFYGLGFIERYQEANPLLRAFLAFGMVDATYAILISRPTASVRFCIQSTVLIYLYWVSGSIVGALFADYVPSMEGAEFILAAFFMILVLDFYMIHRSVLPLIMPVILSIIAYLLVPSLYLVVAICLSLLFLSTKYLFDKKKKGAA